MGPLSGREGPTVDARELFFRYPSKRVGLHPTTFESGPGEVVALIGPNGAGKSTFLRLLATDLRPTSGRLRLLGNDASRPRPSLRRRIAWAPDEPVHLDPLTGRENLRFFARLARAEAEGPGSDLLEAFDLTADGDVPVSEYSFGMRRKLHLAEALATGPDLLLLDEPTVGLDPEGVNALKEEVRRAARRGATVVLATNEIAEAPSWADRILFFHRARLLEDGSRKELLRRVQGRTRISIDFVGDAPHPPGLAAFPGVESVHLAPGRIVVQSGCGTLPLPAVLEAVLANGLSIREIRVREPDLSDVFRGLTGTDLDGTAVPERAHVEGLAVADPWADRR